MEDSEQCLLDLVRTYKVKSIKNRQDNSAMWDVLTETYNKATCENYTKKQLQKRISYMSFKDKKKDQMNTAAIKLDMDEEPIDAKDLVKRADNAKMLADEIYKNVEETIQKRMAVESKIEIMENDILVKKEELKSLNRQLSLLGRTEENTHFNK